MIKLTGNVSKKVPIPGMNFSSQSFGAGMEVEVGNNASTEEIQKKFEGMYNLLETSVKEQITADGKAVPEKEPVKVQKKESKKVPEKKEVPQPVSKEDEPKPVSSRQISLIERLADQMGLSPSEKAKALAVKTLKEASQQIKQMLDTPKKGGRIFAQEGVAK